MTPKLYRELRRIYLATREPTLGRLLLAHEQKKRPRSPSEVRQLSIRVVEVYCDPMQARITVGECIKRQSATEPAGRGKGFPRHEGCKSCALRDIHRAMAPGFVPAPYRVNPNRLRKQRAAMGLAAKRGAFDRIPTIDSPSGED